MGLLLRFSSALIACAALYAQATVPVPYLYTETPRYDPAAVERFPAGAAIQLVAARIKRPLAPSFAASADATVSFDAQHILFSAKPKPADHWQIWETPVAGGAPRCIVAAKEDAIAPFYLPDDRIVYSLRTPAGFQLVTVTLDGSALLQLTYGPGNRVATDVLRDGRILFQEAHELYTIYTDGSGVESYRCDHGPDRRGARQLSSGDIIFESIGRLARFTSARAVQLPLSLPKGEYLGPVAELAPDSWLVSFRPSAASRFGLYLWRQGETKPEETLAPACDAVQPVLVQSRSVPKRHPSALGDREGANLLCLNVYTSKLAILEGSIAKVRVWARTAAAPVLLGEAPVETDGSFYVNLPSETAIRFELLDHAGKVTAAEKNWFWTRRGEQRVCVGCHAGPERSPENIVPQVLLRTTDPVTLTVHGGPK
jgi:hypothetical protein